MSNTLKNSYRVVEWGGNRIHLTKEEAEKLFPKSTKTLKEILEEAFKKG